jgi:nitrate/nitrite-specific signal transduction histidine kinase
MTLRLRLMLVTSGVVLLLFGASEWLSYRQTTELLERHEAILSETADHAVALQRLRDTRSTMFVSVTTMRIFNAAATLFIAVAVLNYVWYRVVYRPIRRLLAQINIMGHGTWKSALPVHRDDEIGELTTAFNDLGQQLTSTFRQINTSSKLSALAFIGNRLMREINVARGELLAVAQTLQTDNQDPAMLSARAALVAIQSKLGRLEAQFQSDFDHEVLTASAGHGTDTDGGEQAQGNMSVSE